MKALLVIDMQVGSLLPHDPPRYDVGSVIARINALASCVRRGGVVVWIQHTRERDGFGRGTAAWQILPELERGSGDLIVEKVACDSFLQTSLEADLRERGVGEVIITGCATDFCVDTTVRAAAAREFAVTVASDAHTTRDREHLDAGRIIIHHNWMWEGLLLPEGSVRVVPTERLLEEMSAAI